MLLHLPKMAGFYIAIGNNPLLAIVPLVMINLPSPDKENSLEPSDLIGISFMNCKRDL